MRRNTIVLLITAALVAAVTSIPAAYVFTGPKWATRTVNYYINPANADVSAAAAEAAIQVGAATWGSQSSADFRFYYMGRTSGSTVLNNGKNEVFFRNVAAGSTVAETYWWTDSGGRLLDADIMFYDGGISFFTGSSGCSGGLYIEDTAAHEFGHALGLGHSSDSSATMYYVTTWCSTSGRTLSNDDLAGVEALYPSSGAPKNSPPSVALTAPSDGASATAPATFSVAATASDSDGSVSRVDFVVNGGVVASDSSSPYSTTLSGLAAGTYAISAIATDNSGATATSASRTVTVSPAVTGTPSSVTFVRTDTSTAGSWKTTYGSEGYLIVGDATSLPAYATVTASGQSLWTWAASTTDLRALLRAAGDRIMAAWYGSVFSIDINITGSQARQVAIYATDYDNGGRQQRFEVIDAATGSIVDSRTMSNFTGGQYLVWNVLGHVVVRVTALSGPNAVVSGLTFGGPSSGGGSGSGAVTFVKTDATTQGIWKGTYGVQGYMIAGDTTSLPSDLQLTVTGQSQWTWATSSSDVRAMQRASSDQVMAAWYGTAFTIDVNAGGTQPRQIAIYSADYDNWGRQQRFDLVDATSGAVLDTRTISSFSGGQYVVWTIQGHVAVKVTRLNGPNAVVSGVLVGGAGAASPSAGASAGFLSTDSVTQGSWKGVYGSEGYMIPGDTAALPSYGQLTTTGALYWLWAASTNDVRAVQRAGSGRIMSASYGMAFTMDLDVGSQSHQVAIYSADYDPWGRQQRFDILDAVTGALLDSRTISSFAGGQYVVWNIQGRVTVRVTALTLPNAVVSGVFFK
jgi:hypothetical protein